jgi:hypothetical protein
LIRTDTTLDHSQEAEKVWSPTLAINTCQCSRNLEINMPCPCPDTRHQLPRKRSSRKSSKDRPNAQLSQLLGGCSLSMLLTRRHKLGNLLVQVHHFTQQQTQKGRVLMPSVLQRSLHYIVVQCPSTARSVELACSVTSLSFFPNKYLPGHRSLHSIDLADYLLDQGGLSAYSAGRRELRTASSPCPVVTGRWILPATTWSGKAYA